MDDENKLLSEELRILRSLDLEDHSQIAHDLEKMRLELLRLKRRNDLLEMKMRKIEKEEHLLSQKVDLDDKFALKKLVVMLKMRNDQLERRGPVHQNQNHQE